MTALAKDRNTRRRYIAQSLVLKVKAATKIYEGAIVAVEDATGFAVPAGDTAGHKVLGVADSSADNTAGADGAKTVKVIKGVFKVNNNGVNPVVQATVGDNAQVADDNTVRASGAVNAVVAGVVQELDADDGGIWIAIL